ncbi:phytanoyl-CoA dioxygenase family protein [Paenibacillus eucommiae]|uniref:Ectoine hydroxylase-related dioxygenase (Phytanoyl-CoA dioxygenase family) n=1 Tax=Paenibacillus eucommiae TaxID=1355755 RepID=A0ABS4ITY8_9BACL|nr:phytanoyl-CoA dioxygenase family protein [Paenibacillus eucommiae]MBP1991037.1 ectoine hydroxylase-related dioxygenase (phytanoyl-CoA dioxygenase family) [Paenibacillus eucommiae]
MSIITKEMKDFFHTNGYVLIKNAVPKADCDKLVQVMWNFMGKSPEDREGWYTPAEGMDTFWEGQAAGMLPLYNHQAMWDIRQHPNVYEAFSEIIGDKKLRVSMDRVSMKPPKRDDHPGLSANFIHWDEDTSNLAFPLKQPRPLQGVVYLADTAANQGGFQCVPSIYRNLEQYLKEQPADRDPWHPDLTGYEVEPIPGEAGDLLIWDVLLPHGNGVNLADKPRFAQYVLMFPEHKQSEADTEMYIECVRTHQGRPGNQVDPRYWEKNDHSQPVQLTPLGRKLLGVEPW